MPNSAPYLVGLKLVPERVPAEPGFPFNIPILAGLDLKFEKPVTFFVGENGTGKSTVMEALAVLCRFPVSGGGRNEIGSNHGPESDSPLVRALRPAFRRHPRDGYFLARNFWRISLRYWTRAPATGNLVEMLTRAMAAAHCTNARTAKLFWRCFRIACARIVPVR